MNYSELLQLAKGWGNFIPNRIIIWRLPLSKEDFEIFQECSQIVLVGDGALISNRKLERVTAAMRVLDEQNDWKLLMRCSILYNRFSSKNSEKAEISDIREIGGIKRYEGCSVGQLLQQLSQEEVFDGLY